MFELLYTRHGGSGLSLTLEDVMDLPLQRIEWFAERLTERREAEDENIRRANASMVSRMRRR